jgi:hypothetical protein
LESNLTVGQETPLQADFTFSEFNEEGQFDEAGQIFQQPAPEFTEPEEEEIFDEQGSIIPDDSLEVGAPEPEPQPEIEPEPESVSGPQPSPIPATSERVLEGIANALQICEGTQIVNSTPAVIAVDTDKVIYTPGQVAKIFLFITDDHGCFVSAPVRLEMTRLGNGEVPVETV